MVVHAREAADTGPRAVADEPAEPVPVLLRRWVQEGLLTAEQAGRIAASERSRPADPHHRRGPVLAEALGYVGAVLAVVAVGLITARYWSELGAWGRVGVAVVAAGLLLATGAVATPVRGDAAARLRSVAWAASVASLALAAWVVVRDLLRWEREASALLVAGLCAAVYAGVLWAVHRRTLQVAALLLALVLAAGAAASEMTSGPGTQVGLAVAGTGAVGRALGWGGLLRPRRAALVLGAVAGMAGAITTIDEERDWGYLVAVGMAACLVGLGLLLHEVGLVVVAVVGSLTAVPAAVTHFFPGRLSAPLALLLVGLALVLVAVRVVRRRRLVTAPARPPGPWRTGDPWVGVALAAVLAGVGTAATVVVGIGG